MSIVIWQHCVSAVCQWGRRWTSLTSEVRCQSAWRTDANSMRHQAGCIKVPKAFMLLIWTRTQPTTRVAMYWVHWSLVAASTTLSCKGRWYRQSTCGRRGFQSLPNHSNAQLFPAVSGPYWTPRHCAGRTSSTWPAMLCTVQL
jgi:hypothetical protein